MIIGNWDYQKQAKKELEKSEKKTAFLCTGDMFALNLIRMFEKNGKRAGQDYGIMGYDNIDFLEYVTPRLTTIDNHVEKVAEEAFNLLLQLMENIQILLFHIQIPLFHKQLLKLHFFHLLLQMVSYLRFYYQS